MLGWFGLLFTDWAHDRHQAYVNEADIVLTDSELKLPQGFNEGCTLDIAHSSAQFDDTRIRSLARTIAADIGDTHDPILDFVGDVRHDLHGLAEIISATLLLNHIRVNLASGDIVIAPERDVEEALVISEVEVDFATVIENEDLAVFERRHGSCIAVQVGVDLD